MWCYVNKTHGSTAWHLENCPNGSSWPNELYSVIWVNSLSYLDSKCQAVIPWICLHNFTCVVKLQYSYTYWDPFSFVMLLCKLMKWVDQTETFELGHLRRNLIKWPNSERQVVNCNWFHGQLFTHSTRENVTQQYCWSAFSHFSFECSSATKSKEWVDQITLA